MRRDHVVTCRSGFNPVDIFVGRRADHLLLNVNDARELPITLTWREAMDLSQKLKRMARILAITEADGSMTSEGEKR